MFFAELLDILKDKNRKKKITLFMGAGCDYSSGGISFKNLKQKILSTYIADDYTLDLKFEQYLKNATPEQKNAVVQQATAKLNLNPSEAYKLLLLLIENKTFDSIFTTNFFTVMEKTQSALNKNVLHIYEEGISVPHYVSEIHSNDKIPYYKLHGNSASHYITHLTIDDLKNLHISSYLIKELKNACKNNVIIFIGYSGMDNLLCKIMGDCLKSNKFIFFVNPQNLNPNSYLAKSIEENLKNIKNINCGFDDFILRIAQPLLKDYYLKESTVFIDSFLNISILNNSKIKGYFDYSKYIKRIDLFEKIEEFLNQQKKNLFILSGNAGKGKHTFLQYLNNIIKSYKNINPIYCDESNKDILDSMVQSIGYKTEDKLSIIYKFSNWVKDRKDKYLFINFASDEKNLEEYFQTVDLCRNNANLKFILSINLDDINKNKKLFSTDVLKRILFSKSNYEASYYLGDFTFEELSASLDSKILSSNGIYDLLKEPAILNIYLNSGNLSLIDLSVNKFKLLSEYFSSGNYNLNNLKKQALNNYNKTNIHCTESQILKNDGSFKNPLFYSYFLGLAWQDSSKFVPVRGCDGGYNFSEIVKNIENILDLNDAEHINAMMFAIGQVSNSDYIIELCVKLLRDSRSTPISKLVEIKELFVQNLINFIAINRYYALFSQLLEKAIENTVILKKIANSCMYLNENESLNNLVVLLNNISDDKTEFRNILHFFVDKCVLVYFHSNEIVVLNALNTLRRGEHRFLAIMKILSDVGKDNTSENKYLDFKKFLLNQLKNCSINKDLLTNYFILYSHNLLFNENNIIDAYALMAQNKELRQLIQNVLDSNKLKAHYLQFISESSKDVCASTRFMLLNLALCELCYKNVQTVTEITKILKYLIVNGSDSNVSQCDFLLSFVFMASYLYDPNLNATNEYWLKNLLSESKIFNMLYDTPGNVRTLNYEDKFDKEFEDGFNPFAFYFYIAPAYVKNNVEEWNHRKSLSIYWDQCKLMHEYGYSHNILRFIHAIGQMIELWPKEGFSALTEFLKYDEPIVHKALIRLCREYYVKYPTYTEEFLLKAGSYFSQEDLIKIKSTFDTRLETRTFEQLHWVRIILAFLETDADFIKKILQSFLEESSFKGFFNKVLDIVLSYNV